MKIVWVLVALALLGIGYEVGRSGVAKGRPSGPAPRKPPVVAPSDQADHDQYVAAIRTALNEPMLLAGAHYDLGVCLFYRGMLPLTLKHHTQCLAISEFQPDASVTYRLSGYRLSGRLVNVMCHAYAFMALWASDTRIKHNGGMNRHRTSVRRMHDTAQLCPGVEPRVIR